MEEFFIDEKTVIILKTNFILAPHKKEYIINEFKEKLGVNIILLDDISGLYIINKGE